MWSLSISDGPCYPTKNGQSRRVTCIHNKQWALCPNIQCKTKSDTYWTKRASQPTNKLTYSIQNDIEHIVMNVVLSEIDESINKEMIYHDTTLEEMIINEVVHDYTNIDSTGYND